MFNFNTPLDKLKKFLNNDLKVISDKIFSYKLVFYDFLRFQISYVF